MADEFENRPHGRATIVDVAKKAGVSVASASQALRGAGRISVGTRESIKAAAQALNYVPNKHATSLRSGMTREIGLLVQDVSNPFNAELTAGVASVFEETSHLIYLLDAVENVDRQQRLIESIVQSGVCGLLWHPARATPETTVDFVKEAQLPTVTALRSFPGEPFDHVGVNDFQSSQDAARHLISRGHRHVGFLGGQEGVLDRSTQFAGYISALYEAGIEVDRDYCEPCATDKRSARNAMLNLLNRAPQLTSVMCYNDVVAFGAMFALASEGKVVGKDFAVVGCDDIADAALSIPSLTTVAVSPYKVGIELARALLVRLDEPERDHRSLILGTSVVVRDSTSFILQGGD
ncbi:LacI family DNA-binding transcriptional regulator [Mesorhizobium sp. M1233]|uniref:LacI family DNA-binding transcriptional regulator n=1 Tax=Mesorhizobium sp. M1233 TaxID=2957072 RepID=UPI00333CE04F